MVKIRGNERGTTFFRGGRVHRAICHRRRQRHRQITLLLLRRVERELPVMHTMRVVNRINCKTTAPVVFLSPIDIFSR